MSRRAQRSKKGRKGKKGKKGADYSCSKATLVQRQQKSKFRRDGGSPHGFVSRFGLLFTLYRPHMAIIGMPLFLVTILLICVMVGQHASHLDMEAGSGGVVGAPTTALKASTTVETTVEIVGIVTPVSAIDRGVVRSVRVGRRACVGRTSEPTDLCLGGKEMAVAILYTSIGIRMFGHGHFCGV